MRRPFVNQVLTRGRRWHTMATATIAHAGLQQPLTLGDRWLLQRRTRLVAGSADTLGGPCRRRRGRRRIRGLVKDLARGNPAPTQRVEQAEARRTTGEGRALIKPLRVARNTESSGRWRSLVAGGPFAQTRASGSNHRGLRRAVIARLAPLSITASLLSTLGGAPPAYGFCDLPSLEWPKNSLTGRATDSFPPWMPEPLGVAMDAWNGVSGANWQLFYLPNLTDTDVKMRFSTYTGMANVPGSVKLVYSNGTITAADIYFNPSWNWNNEGVMNQANQKVDVRTVAVHEWGHQIYLNHPAACGGTVTNEEQNAVMTVEYTKKWYTKPDDRAGLAYVK